MVVPVAEVCATNAGGQAGIGLGDNVVHDSAVGNAVFDVFAEGVVVGGFPHGRVFIGSEDAADVHLFLFRQAVHAAHEQVHIEEGPPGIEARQGRIRVLEQSAQHILIAGQLAQEEVLRRFRIGEYIGRCRPFIAIRVILVVGPGGLHIQHALMLVHLRLGRQAGDGAAAGRHTEDGTDHGAGTGVHFAPFPEDRRETPDHRLRDILVLLPAQRGQIPHVVAGLVPEGLQVRQQFFAAGRQIPLLLPLGEHFQDDSVGLGGVRITRTVPAIMADVNSLIALGRGRGGLRRLVIDAVQAGGLVPVGPHFLADIGALGL